MKNSVGGLVVVLLLMGCHNAEQPVVLEHQQELSTVFTKQQLPTLQLQAGDTLIKTYKGTYKWHLVDEQSQQMMVIQADHASPLDMVALEKARALDLSMPITLLFSTPPTSYEIRLWDEQGVVASYSSFEQISLHGKFVVEIIGLWEGSMATYVVALAL